MRTLIAATVLLLCVLTVLVSAAFMFSVYPPGCETKPFVGMFVILPATAFALRQVSFPAKVLFYYGLLLSPVFVFVLLEDPGTRMSISEASGAENRILAVGLGLLPVVVGFVCFVVGSGGLLTRDLRRVRDTQNQSGEHSRDGEP